MLQHVTRITFYLVTGLLHVPQTAAWRRPASLPTLSLRILALLSAYAQRQLPYDRALELGCGTGFFLLNLIQAGVARRGSVTDLSPGMVKVATRNGQSLGLDIDGRVADAEGIPYADDTFDCTYPPSDGTCPASQFQVTDGTHEIVVFSWGSCATQFPEYTIALNASWDPDLTLKTDNADRYLDQTLTFSSFEASGCGILYDDGIPDDAVRCEPASSDDGGESEGD